MSSLDPQERSGLIALIRELDLRSLHSRGRGTPMANEEQELSGAPRLGAVSVILFRNCGQDLREIRTWPDTPEGNLSAAAWFVELVRGEHAQADMANLDIEALLADGEWSDSDTRILLAHAEP